MSTKTAPKNKKNEVVEDEFENLDSEDLSLDEGLNESEEENELEEGLNEEEETTEDLPETLDDIEEPAPAPVKKTPTKTPAPAKKAPAKKADPEPEPEESLDDVELEEGDGEEETLEADPEPEPVKPTKKTAAKPAAKKTEDKPEKQKLEEYISKYGGEYNEEFDIKKVKLGKYEIRESVRSPERITELADDIKSRGQLEPVHIIHEGKEYHLIAGYHRYLALKEINADTIRAIIYKDLNFSQIQAIATGTNAIRTDLSEWDKICAVAKYHEANPDIPIFVKQENVTTLCSIFGYKKTRIYEYINVYDFLKNFKNEALLEYVKSASLPIHYLTGLYNLREHIKADDADQIIKLFKERPDLRIKEFDVEFTSYLNEIHMSNDPDAGTDDELVDGDIDIPTDKKTKTDKVAEAMEDDDENDEGKELSRNIKKKTNECINKLTEVHTILTELTQYDNLKELVEDKITKVLIKRATEISKLSSKLFN